MKMLTTPNPMMYSEMMINFSLIYLSIVMIITILILKNNHPVELMIYLVMFSIIMCLKTSLLNKNFWFSYLLFLTMIGGILILFLYFVSTASNEKSTPHKMNKNVMMTISTMLMAIFIVIMIMYDTFSINLIEYTMNQCLCLLDFNWSETNDYKMTQMFNNNYKITMMIMMYLLFTLFSVMKMCMKMYGPLRQYL